MFTLLLAFVLGGFIIAKDDIVPWMKWGYYASPMMYGQNALAINGFLEERWSTPIIDPSISESTVGKMRLRARGMFVQEYWYWICIGALFGFSLLFNVCFIAALTHLSPFSGSKAIIVDKYDGKKRMVKSSTNGEHSSKTTEISSASTTPMSEGLNKAAS